MTQATATHPSLPAVDPSQVAAEPTPILDLVLGEHPMPVIDLDALHYPDYMHEVEALVQEEMDRWSEGDSIAREEQEKASAEQS